MQDALSKISEEQISQVQNSSDIDYFVKRMETGLNINTIEQNGENAHFQNLSRKNDEKILRYGFQKGKAYRDKVILDYLHKIQQKLGDGKIKVSHLIEFL